MVPAALPSFYPSTHYLPSCNLSAVEAFNSPAHPESDDEDDEDGWGWRDAANGYHRCNTHTQSHKCLSKPHFETDHTINGKYIMVGTYQTACPHSWPPLESWLWPCGDRRMHSRCTGLHLSLWPVTGRPSHASPYGRMSHRSWNTSEVKLFEVVFIGKVCCFGKYFYLL